MLNPQSNAPFLGILAGALAAATSWVFAGDDAVSVSAPARSAATAPTDRHGDPLPPEALARFGAVRWRLPEAPVCTSFSGDGKTLSTVGADRVLTAWDAASGRPLRRRTIGEGSFEHACVSPDGALLANVTRKTDGSGLGFIELWDLNAGRKCGDVHPPDDGNSNHVLAYPEAFSPDGKTLVTLRPTNRGIIHAELWDVANRTMRIELKLEGNWGFVRFSPDGRRLASVASFDRKIRLWDPGTGKPMDPILEGTPSYNVPDMAFLPDGRSIAVLERDQGVHIIDVATGRKRFPAPLLAREFTLAPNGEALALLVHDSIVIVETATGRERCRIPSAAPLTHAPVSPSAKLLFAPDSRWIAARIGSNVLRWWDAATGKEVPAFDGHELPVTALAFGDDGATLTSAGADGVRRWDVATTRQRSRWGMTAGDSVGLSPDGACAVVARRVDGAGDDDFGDVVFRLRDAVAGKELNLIRNRVERIAYTAAGALPSAFSADGKRVAAWGPDGIAVRDRATGEQRSLLKFKDRNVVAVRALALSPDGKIAASVHEDPQLIWRKRTGIQSWLRTLTLWDVATGKEVYTGSAEGDLLIAFAPVGETLVVASVVSGAANRLEAPSGKLVQRLGKARLDLKSLDTLRDGLATEVERFGTFLNDLNFPQGPTCLAISPNGKTLALGEADHSISLWDLAAAKESRRFRGHRDRVTSLAFTPDGKALASGSADTTILLWPTGDRSKEVQP